MSSWLKLIKNLFNFHNSMWLHEKKIAFWKTGFRAATFARRYFRVVKKIFDITEELSHTHAYLASLLFVSVCV